MEIFLKNVPQAIHSIRKSLLQGQSILTENSVLSNVLSQPSECVLTSNIGHINVMFLPTTFKVLMGPIDKAVILPKKKC